ncbi:hypothetical protein C8R45DRAFT_1069979 [Mycena sanguinolenta]|nr:hypothetical protein C8R45DRAFT_1069979 [Mycena sanguinolenta]
MSSECNENPLLVFSVPHNASVPPMARFRDPSGPVSGCSYVLSNGSTSFVTAKLGVRVGNCRCPSAIQHPYLPIPSSRHNELKETYFDRSPFNLIIPAAFGSFAWGSHMLILNDSRSVISACVDETLFDSLRHPVLQVLTVESEKYPVPHCQNDALRMIGLESTAAFHEGDETATEATSSLRLTMVNFLRVYYFALEHLTYDPSFLRGPKPSKFVQLLASSLPSFRHRHDVNSTSSFYLMQAPECDRFLESKYFWARSVGSIHCVLRVKIAESSFKINSVRAQVFRIVRLQHFELDFQRETIFGFSLDLSKHPYFTAVPHPSDRQSATLGSSAQSFLKGSTTDHSELRDLNLPIFTADALEQRSPNSFRHVKHLFISDYAVEQPMLNNWLLACTGVTNLYAWLDWEPEIPASISRFTHVQYLVIDVRALFGTAVPLPLFLTVTHLELLDYPEDESVDRICHNISLIPRLTHLALNPHLDSKLSHAALCANIQLRCIVFLSPAKSLRDSPLLDDDRFVCIDEAEDFYQD